MVLRVRTTGFLELFTQGTVLENRATQLVLGPLPTARPGVIQAWQKPRLPLLLLLGAHDTQAL